MPSNVEKAAEVIEHTLKTRTLPPPKPWEGQIGHFGGMSALELAQALADAGLIPGDDAKTGVQWGVRTSDGADIIVGSEHEARKLRKYPNQFANHGYTLTAVVNRTVTTHRTLWQPVEDTDNQEVSES